MPVFHAHQFQQEKDAWADNHAPMRRQKLVKRSIYLLLCSVFWKLNGLNFKAYLLTRISRTLVRSSLFCPMRTMTSLGVTPAHEVLNLSSKFFSYRLWQQGAPRSSQTESLSSCYASCSVVVLTASLTASARDTVQKCICLISKCLSIGRIMHGSVCLQTT